VHRIKHLKTKINIQSAPRDIQSAPRDIQSAPRDIQSAPRNIQSAPRNKHTVSVVKTSQLMLYGEIIAVCSVILTEHTCTLWAKVEFLALKTLWY
jgi:hypothetical protein